MLRVRGISKRYGAVAALTGVDLEVHPGEVVALAGENGSGKSTLSRIIAGAARPDEGTIEMDGISHTFARPRDALNQGVALVAQELTAVPEMSVAENVLLAFLQRPASWVSRRALAARAQVLLDRVGVEAHPGTPFSALRVGDRELVELAKALAVEPRVLILDEATSRLGEREVARLFEIVRRLRDEGTGIVLITHRLPEITAIADRAVVLRDGRVAGELAREEIDEDRVTALMVGRSGRPTARPEGAGTAPGPVALRVEGLLVEGARDPLSLDVRGGEVVGLAGLVGAGRTELLETLAGRRRPRGGRVLVDGRPVDRLGSTRAALRAGIALVPEDRHRQGLNLQATVRENLAMGSWAVTRPATIRADRARGMSWLGELLIRTAGIDAPVRELSGGNQQKVVIARCLMHQPRVLLLDEPTRGVDVGARAEIYRIVRALTDDGVAVVLASSDLEEILTLSDRIVVLHEQRLAGALPRDEASEERVVSLSAGGKG